MKIINAIFSRIPRKIFKIMLSGYDFLFYRYFLSTKKLKTNMVPKRYILCGGQSLKESAENFRKLFVGRTEEKIKEADLICEHLFDLLGSGRVSLSSHGTSRHKPYDRGYKQIDWHSDFKSGYRWDPETLHHNVRYGYLKGVDIKVPWELSRFQHLNVLGQTYILTKNMKYAEEISNQIIDWIKSNPVGFGVNWKCTMDATIRVVNWLIAMEYFTDDNILSEDVLKEIYTSVYEHGRFIRSNLENSSKWTTNHYLANIAGLYFISVYCPFFKESRDWQEFSLQELCKEIEKQVYTDGCSFEASTSYHRLATEIFFYAAVLGDRAGIMMSDVYKSRMKKMFEFSLHCIKPDGTIPQIGDNDNGRFLKFSNIPVLEHKYLLSIAAVYFKDNKFKLKQADLDEETYWVFGENSEIIWNSLVYRDKFMTSSAFPDAGWYIIRNENDYCFISCGLNGGCGWHAHNDKLSFELIINGRDVIVDPGTYAYTSYPEERNRFRSTEYHNTIKFNGYEQNEFSDKGIFVLPERVRITGAVLAEDDDKISFQGEIHYADVRHKRVVMLDKKSGNWQIEDSFSCMNQLKARLIYHLSPDIIYKGNNLITKDKRDKIAKIAVRDYELNKIQYEYSPEYGAKKEAEALVADITAGKENKTVHTSIVRF
jgi:hypothetical protein